MRHVTLYRERGRYAGWPANYGIWSWGDEIVVGFTVGYLQASGGFHARDTRRPFISMQARSLDGGRTWRVQPTPCRTPGNRALSADEHVDAALSAREALRAGTVHAPVDSPGGIDFAHPDFALMCARTGLGAGTVSWFYTSTDRCHSWQGPFALPTFDQAGIEARTDYLADGSDTCTLFLTASRPDGGEGGGVLCARAVDAGRTFAFLSWVTQVDEGYAIMPSSVRLSPSRILVAIRRQGPGRQVGVTANWIDLYASEDNGLSWVLLARPVPDTGRGGNPPALIRLSDGRLCLTYGVRARPYAIMARLGADSGMTWGDEIVLTQDGGNHDLGYTRSTQRPDGTIVTVYYFNDEPEGERYIAATLWEPD